MKEVTSILGIFATESLKLKIGSVINFKGQVIDTERLDESEIVIAPILRAGLIMSEALSELVPSARIAHIGLYRDKEKQGVINYLVSMPDINPKNVSNLLLLDPVMATGMTIISALEEIISFDIDPSKVSIICAICSADAISEIYSRNELKNVAVYTAAVDPGLDDDLYVVPGMGDAGDRLFGTEAGV